MAVVVAVDLSEGSARTVGVAAEVAVRLGQPLTVVHVMWPPPFRPRAAASVLSKLGRAPREVGGQLHGSQSESAVSTMLLFGKPDERLLQYLAEHPAVVLVVASPGKAPGFRFVTGGTVDGILRRAPCPVLVVPPGPASPGLASPPQATVH